MCSNVLGRASAMRLSAASPLLLLVLSLVGTLYVSRRSPEVQEHERAIVRVFVFVCGTPCAHERPLLIARSRSPSRPLSFLLSRPRAGMSLGATIYVPRSVNEGATTTLQAQPTATSLSPLQYKWDLDADGIYGETGPSANHGDETGRFVLFTTVGRDGSRLPAGSWPVSVQLWYTSNSSPGALQEQGSNTVTIANVAPSIDSTGGPYTTTGASATLTARASDPGGKAPTVLWDLDLDGVFGETGSSAQNGDEVGATVTYTTAVTEATRTNTVRVKAFDGSLYSDIKSTTINVPGLLSTHRCPCASSATREKRLRGAAVFRVLLRTSHW